MFRQPSPKFCLNSKRDFTGVFDQLHAGLCPITRVRFVLSARVAWRPGRMRSGA